MQQYRANGHINIAELTECYCYPDDVWNQPWNCMRNVLRFTIYLLIDTRSRVMDTDVYSSAVLRFFAFALGENYNHRYIIDKVMMKINGYVCKAVRQWS